MSAALEERHAKEREDLKARLAWERTALEAAVHIFALIYSFMVVQTLMQS